MHMWNNLVDACYSSIHKNVSPEPTALQSTTHFFGCLCGRDNPSCVIASNILTPLAGWVIHKQNLRIRNGFQTIAATGAFVGLDSHYDAQWTAPWIGFDAGMALNANTHIKLNFAYNLRSCK